MDHRFKKIVFSAFALSLLSSEIALTAPTASIWSGAGGNSFMTTPGNWVTPPGIPTPDPATSITFPGTQTVTAPATPQYTVTDNLTTSPFQIGSLSITGNPAGTPVYNISSATPSGSYVLQFSGGTAGSITVTGNNSQLQTNTLNVPIQNNLGATALSVTSVNGIFSYQGSFTGTGAITYHGNANTPSVNFPGTILLSGNNSGDSGTIVLTDNVILQFAAANALGPNAGTIIFSTVTTSGGVLQPTVSGITLPQTIGSSGGVPITFDLSLIPNGTLTVSDISSLNNPSIEVGWNESIPLTNSTLIITNAITNASSLTINSNAIVQLSAGNSYTGLTTINSGTLQPTANAVLSTFSPVVFANASSAILDLTLGPSQFVGGLSGTGPGGTVILSNQFLTVQGTSSTFGGSIISAPGSLGGGLALNLTAGNTLTLTGNNNTYEGDTVIVTGTLQAGATNAFSPNAGIDILAGGMLSLNNFNNTVQAVNLSGPVSLGSGTLTLTLPVNGVAYSGTITGVGGGLTINSPAGNTWTMTGTGSNYSGPTTILSGTLAAGINNAFSPNSPIALANNSSTNLQASGFINTIAGLSGGGSSGGNVIVDGGQLTITQSGSTTYGGVISGTGNTGAQGFYLNGGGTLALTGNNTITNLINISGGSTLEASATNAFSPNALVSLTTSATLNLNGFNNTIGGLTGDFTPTILLGSGILTIQGSTPLTATYAGSITGSGGLTLNVSAGNTLQLSGTTNYSGPTTINSGILQAGTAAAFSPNSLFTLADSPAAVLDLTIHSNTIGGLAGGGLAGGNVLLGVAALTVQGSNATSYAGSISGTGPIGLLLYGPGSLFLDGANTYSGVTLVNAGATLGGTGSVTSNVSVFGTMSPGDRTGTFHILGTYKQESGSTFYSEITPSTNTTLMVSGSATIDPNASFIVDPQPGVYTQNQTYTVIAAGSLAGTTFSSINSTSILISASLSYPAPNVVLTLEPHTISSFVGKGNAHKVAVALDSILASGSQAVNVILSDIFYLSAAEMNYALDQMHPAQLKAQTLIQEDNAIKVRDALLNHLAIHTYEDPCSPCRQPFTAWVEGLGDWLRQDKTHYASSPQVGYTDFMSGVVLGAEYRFTDTFGAGLLGAYTHSDTKWLKDHGHGTIQSEYVGIYLSAENQWCFATLSGISIWNQYQSARNIIFPGTSKTAKGRTDGYQFITSLDLGLIYEWFGLSWSPFNTFDYIAQYEKKFTETNANVYNLKIRKSNVPMLRNELGLNFSRSEWSHGVQWVFDGKISWVREMRLDGGHFTSEFVGTDVPFTVTGYMPDRSLVSPGASITALIYKRGVSCNVYYNGMYNRNFSDSSIGAGLTYTY